MLAARIVFAVLSALVLAALWIAFRPQAPIQAKVIEAATPAPVVPVKKEFEFVVRDGKRISGPAALQVRQGEQVVLRIESSANDELHLHGYELKRKLKGGEPALLEFAASRSGRFEIELHRRHTQLGALEVYPQ